MSHDASSARDQLQRLESLFHAALNRPSRERSAFLSTACRGDESLRRDIERLLRQHDDPSSFMAEPIWGRARAIPSPESLRVKSEFSANDRIGNYRLVHQLGAGGMGTVWLAERDDAQYQQQVALKIVKRGMDTDSILRRFHNERQVMAHLNHPNIARLLDGGATDDGRPYLVMEYVDGIRIDEFCEKHQHSTDRRLQLFLNVCGAVRYAHEHLIVHRDLKPSNIMVTRDGEPKLLDFGIAKVLNSDDPSATASSTAPDRLVFTPRYASPEQIRGKSFTTAGDVYSLGVVLYELLTGQSPYDVSATTRGALERAVLEIDPSRPSTLCRALNSEIDAILMKSLAKDPLRRYATVDALTADVERFLNGDAVLAHAPGAFYQLRKIGKRHRMTFAFCSILILLVMSFAVVAGGLALRLNRERDLAQRRFDETRALARALVYDLNDAMAPIRGTLPARELIVETGVRYLDALADEAGDDISLLLECADGYFRIAEIQGSPSSASLGQTALALQTCRKGRSIIHELVEEHGEDKRVRLQAAFGMRVYGDLLSTSNEAVKAVEQFESAIEFLNELREPDGQDADVLVALEKTHFNLATCHERADRYDDAERHFNKAIEVIEDRIAAGGDPHKAKLKRANAQAALGHVLVQRGAIDDAAGLLTEAIEVLELAVETHPERGNSRRSLIVASMDLGRVWLAQGNADAARMAFESAIRRCELFVDSDPDDVAVKRDLSTAHRLLAKLLETAGEFRESLHHFEETIRIREAIVALDPAQQLSLRDLAVALDGAGSVLRKLGRFESALKNHQSAKSLFEAMYQSDPENPRNMRSLAIAAFFLGEIQRDMADQNINDTTTRAELIQFARRNFEQSRNLMRSLQERGLLREDESEIVKMLSKEINTCGRLIEELD